MSEPESPAEYIPLSDAEYAPYVKLVALGASDPIDAIRAAIFEGQITDDEIKAAFEVSQPTLERYIAAGLPHYRVGNQRRSMCRTFGSGYYRIRRRTQRPGVAGVHANSTAGPGEDARWPAAIR